LGPGPDGALGDLQVAAAERDGLAEALDHPFDADGGADAGTQATMLRWFPGEHRAAASVR
jgi:hypothetical protein